VLGDAAANIDGTDDDIADDEADVYDVWLAYFLESGRTRNLLLHAVTLNEDLDPFQKSIVCFMGNIGLRSTSV